MTMKASSESFGKSTLSLLSMATSELHTRLFGLNSLMMRLWVREQRCLPVVIAFSCLMGAQRNQHHMHWASSTYQYSSSNHQN